MPDPVAYSLLANGLDFVLSALDHLRGTPSARDLKYATLHLSSGVELVLKERLRLEHWSLVFARPEKANHQAYETGEFTSVMFEDCLSRLVDIAGVHIVDSDRQELLHLRRKRNRLEHFAVVDSVEALTSTAGRALAFLMDFVDNNFELATLNDDERAAIDAIRGALGDCQAFVAERWREVEHELKMWEARVERCPMCYQDALTISGGVRCLFCNYSAKGDVAAEQYAANVLGISNYDVFKEGGIGPVHECPVCETTALVDTERGGGQFPVDQYVCFACGAARKDGELDTCGSCGKLYDPGEDQSPMCPDCWNWQMSKD